MNTQVDIPVLIVGAGATGSVLAMELARHGVDYRCIDKLPEAPNTSKAITVHARSMEMIQRVDQGLIERFLNRGIHNQGYVLHFVKEGQRSEARPGMDFTSLNCDFPYLLVHRQSETEQFIREYTEQQLNRTVDWNTALKDFQQDEAGISVTLIKNRNPEDTESIRCQYLVGCDGGNSTVQKILNVSGTEGDYQGTRFQNLDATLNNFPDVDDFAHYCVGIDHFLMVVKLPGGFYRLLLSDKGDLNDKDNPHAPFQHILDQHFDGVSIDEEIWHSDWQSIVKLADQYRYDRVFLAGDCAHVHSTTGGQGLNCCMQDAFNLGWKLGMVLKGQLKPELLDSYESERRPIAEQVIWAASSLHDIFMNHGRDMTERMAEMEDSSFVDKVVGRVAGLSYTYRDDVNIPQNLTELPGPAIGDRVPNAALNNKLSLVELQRHCGFTLLGILPKASIQSEEMSACLQILQNSYPEALITSSQVETADFIEQYGHMDSARLYLIRPDGYLAYRCLLSEHEYLQSYLHDTLL